MLRRRLILPAALAAACLAAATPAAAQSSACAREADSIRRAQRQLPRLEVAPPDDQQIVCITLETNILFARRLVAHLARCPRSPIARESAAWQGIGSDYMAQFSRRRCKPAVRGFHG